MQARHSISRRPVRRGFTLIELLVVISIIATLMALLLPAIQNAREAARRTQCLNNQRNIATALHGWAGAHAGEFPAYGYFIDDPLSAGSNAPQRSWVVELLPYLEQQGLFDRWDKTLDLSVAANANLAIADFNISVLSCPNDDSAVDSAGNLSYVVNAGFGDGVGAATGIDHNYTVEQLDWDNDAAFAPTDTFDSDITELTGVFWAEYAVTAAATTKPSANLGRIYDGTGNTLMMGENLWAGTDNTPLAETMPRPALQSWASPEHKSCTFIVPVTLAGAAPDVAGGLGNSLIYNPGASSSTFGYAVQTPSAADGPFPNDGKTSGIEGETPYLNSLHPGIVVVGFCDGSVKTLNESIDESVYLRLVTPNATKERSNIQAEDPLSGTDF